VVYEDKKIMALMTIAPANPGHVLVIAKKHFRALASMDEKMGMYLFKITMRVADAIRKSGVRCEGINLFLSDGEPQQEILHLHMHVIPSSAETISGYPLTTAPDHRERNLTERQTKCARHTNGYGSPRIIT
jgi:histidine triad (HIT) family protein